MIINKQPATAEKGNRIKAYIIVRVIAMKAIKPRTFRSLSRAKNIK